MILTTAAFNDVAEARAWYERQAPGLGARFIGKVDETLGLIEHNPLAFQTLIEDARRANVARFPYGVWYVLDDQPLVIGCLHHRRNSLVLKDRIPG